MKSYGSIWTLAVAHILAATPNVTGLLYLCNDGNLVLVSEDAEAPARAMYVARVFPQSKPAARDYQASFLAARLAHVAVRLMPPMNQL